MKVQYCSDLHLEFERNNKYLTNNPLKICGDILILAGDIAPLHDEFINNSFLKNISKNYSRVFWVPGNHEYYYRNISDYGKSFNIKIFSNINIVSNIEFKVEDVNFVFSTLWSRISKGNEKTIEQSVSDFDCITNNDKKFKASDFNKLHDESLTFLKQALKSKRDNVVVVTHHLPSHLCNAPDHNNSPIREAFCVELTDFIEKNKANFWLYGHSHYNQSPLVIGKTIMLTNQLGYVHLNESRDFKLNAYFSI